MRVDKYLWAIRLFKTRSLATKECSGNKILVNDDFIKPSKDLKIGDTIAIKINPIWKTYKVLQFPKSRVGAKLVADYLAETTSEADLKILETTKEIERQMRVEGFRGRPTKRDRRKIDQFNS